MTLTQQAIEILFDGQAGKIVQPGDIKRLFNTACDTLPKPELRDQFMPVMQRIWYLVETGEITLNTGE